MKGIKLLFSLLIIPFILPSQSIDDFLIYDQKSLEKFYKTTTYVVLDQHKESRYSKAIQEAVKEYWTITPVEFISQADYRVMIKDKTKSFLTRNYIYGDDKLISLSLFMGGQRQLETKGKIIANVKLKHYTETDEDMLYKLPIYVQNLQWQVEMIRNQKYTGMRNFENYFKQQRPTLHQMKLYILKDHLTSKVPDKEKLEKFYKHNVSIVGLEQLEDAIVTDDSTVAFLSIVAPTKNWNGQTAYYGVYKAAGGEWLEFYNRPVSSAAPAGVVGADLKKLNK